VSESTMTYAANDGGTVTYDLGKVGSPNSLAKGFTTGSDGVSLYDPRYNLDRTRAQWDKAEYAGRDGLGETAEGLVMSYSANMLPWHGKGQTGDPLDAEGAALASGWARRGPDGEVVWLEYEKVPVTEHPISGGGRAYWLRNRDTSEVFPRLARDLYEFVQPRETFQFAQALVAGPENEDGSKPPAALIESAVGLRGSRGNPHTLCVSLRVPEFMVLQGPDGRQDVVVWFLNVLNSFDGLGKFVANVSPWRVQCRNSARFSTRDALTQVRLRHTPNVADRVEETRKALGLLHKVQTVYRSEAERLLAQEINNAVAADVIASLYPAPAGERAIAEKNRKAKIDGMVARLDAPEVAAVAGTLYGVEQAIGHWYDWGTKVKAEGGTYAQGGEASEWARGQAMLLGTNDKAKERVHQRLLALA
jgi:hypothetical protein